MLKCAPAIVAMAALWGAGCGGGSSSSSNSGPVTAPTPVAQTQPPAVNVNDLGPPGGDNNLWSNGRVSFDAQTGTNTLGLQLTQTGAQVTGRFILYGPDGGAGPLSGTVSGNTLSFNFSVGNQGQGCGNTASATATVDTSTITGTFSGRRCNGQSYTNGKFMVGLPSGSGYSTTRFSVTGTWKGNLPAALGGGTSTWTLSQDGDVNGGNLTGSITVTGNNTLKLTSGSVTGTVTNNFPGPPQAVSVTTNASLAGNCPTTLTLPTTFNGSDGQTLTLGYKAAGWSGTNCNGSMTPFGFNVLRQ